LLLIYDNQRAAIKAGYAKKRADQQAHENLMKPEVQQAIRDRMRPRLQRLDITLDHTLEECRRLAYGRLGDDFEDESGELRPVCEWPREHVQTAVQVLAIKRLALADVMRYMRHSGVYGQPQQPQNVTLTNNVTIVPIERLTDEELDFYERMAAKGRAIQIESAVLPPEPAEPEQK
jgi:hypothetical protein